MENRQKFLQEKWFQGYFTAGNRIWWPQMAVSLRISLLQVNESSLTGESTNVDKSEQVILQEASFGDRVNMVYSGSLVTYGRAEVMVTEIGMKTEIGKIAGLMNATVEKKTPLQIS